MSDHCLDEMECLLRRDRMTIEREFRRIVRSDFVRPISARVPPMFAEHLFDPTGMTLPKAIDHVARKLGPGMQRAHIYLWILMDVVPRCASARRLVDAEVFEPAEDRVGNVTRWPRCPRCARLGTNLARRLAYSRGHRASLG